MNKRTLVSYLPAIFIAVILCNAKAAHSQQITCDSQLLYIATMQPFSGNSLFAFNPAAPLSAANPYPIHIPVPGSLAVSPNLNNPLAPSPTFYTASGAGLLYGEISYWDGSAWVGTGHTAGPGPGFGLGAGGGFIYSISNDGDVYRYNGTGNAVFVVSVLNWLDGSVTGTLDISADCAGNFYVLKPYPAQDAWLRKYSPAGTLLQQWDITGLPLPAGFGGNNSFAIVGDSLYFDVPGLLTYSGYIGAGTVAVTPIVSPLFPTWTGDFASCSGIGGVDAHKSHLLFRCDPAAGMLLTSSGNAPFQHTVLSGSVTISGTGPAFTANGGGDAVIVITSAGDPACTPVITDTFRIVAPPAVDAGPDQMVTGCIPYPGNLQGIVSNMSSAAAPNYSWAPAGLIVSGGNTLSPTFSIPGDTTFRLTVTLPNPGQNDCVLTDSVRIRTQQKTFELALNTSGLDLCPGQSGELRVVPAVAGTDYQWYRNDAPIPAATGAGLMVDLPGDYWLYARNSEQCIDSSDVVTATLHNNPEAAISWRRGPICTGDTVSLTATGGQEYTYHWEPEHVFALSGANQSGVTGLFDQKTTRVVLTTLNAYGCMGKDSLILLTEPCCTIFIPNAFSPNHDSRNDYFRPELKPGQTLTQFRIFDRWGNQVYNNTNLPKGWDGSYTDGEPAATGTYMYYIQYTCSDNKIYTQKEALSLIR
ncbi:gliding motility-associated C-terminal domain-containing protein [Taibaiella koreensis]|uniref:gliding motility-associated C-terminal domain-containing protein n=1 Tax=Taibaiella koreensis TaxID=1268548 RepID=UPI000E59A995|nr:gliding motility-associated C-terminal domain-containing protein [Taibaiella koreensis]